jgi:hypothetical protein
LVINTIVSRSSEKARAGSLGKAKTTTLLDISCR